MITRNIINRDVVYDGRFKYEHIDSLINRWKNLFVNEGARKGDLVAISILNVDVWHVSAVFACAELGLRIILLDSPAKMESLPYTKLARFGPARFCLDDGSGRNLYDGLHQSMITRYSQQILNIRQCADSSSDPCQPWEVEETDPFLVSSTSGTTQFSRMVEFNHRDVLWMSKRNIDVFEFKPWSTVLHTKNMHHASALITSLFPALMCCKEHFHMTLPDGEQRHSQHQVLQTIDGCEITHMIVPNNKILNWLLSTGHIFRRNVLMNMSGFTMGPDFNHLCKLHNISFIQHYGSIDVAIPLLTRKVTKDSFPEENCLGTPPDDTYNLTPSTPSGILWVDHPDWNHPKSMGDIVEFRNEKYYHLGRAEVESGLDIPEDIDLEPFYQDTKINMDQLRGFLITKNSKKSA